MTPSPATLGLLDRLIAFDTVSARSNRALIDFAADHLKALGIRAEVVPSADGAKASLWSMIGPAVDGGVVLSGHSDVVPVDGQAWTSDPFRLSLRDGRAFGRGTADMKGFIACALAAAEQLRDRGLKRPVHIALTFDEEVGCLGAPELIGWAAERRPRPSIVVVGEPTMMTVVNAHKGISVCRTHIHGVEAHSSLSHLGVSAIHLAAQAIGVLKRLEQDWAARVSDPRFEPSSTTVSVNRIEGGTAVNILAGEVWFDWDIRAVPGASPAELRQAFEAALEAEVIAPARVRHAGVRAKTRLVADAPPLRPDPEGPGERLAMRLLGANDASVVPFAAEAGQYQGAGYSAVIVGPGSIEQAHKADEFVALDQLARCERFIDDLGAELSR
jgi:acetylornithine deacetylase